MFIYFFFNIKIYIYNMTNECGVVQSGVASGSRIVRATFRPVGNTSASSSSLCKYISNIIMLRKYDRTIILQRDGRTNILKKKKIIFYATYVLFRGWVNRNIIKLMR